MPVAVPDVEHEAKRHGKNEVEAPWNEAPVIDGEDPCPVLELAQLRDVGIGGVHYPFRKGIEEDVGGEAAGEHHAAP